MQADNKKMKNALIFILLFSFIFMFIKSILQDKAYNKDRYTKGLLADNIRKEISFKGNNLTIKEKSYTSENNGVKIKTDKGCLSSYGQVNSFYIPQEGGFIYKEYTDGETSLYTNTCGLTFRPCGGIAFTSGKSFSPFLGARFFYYGSFGGGLIACKEGVMLCADKRLDNLAFFRNTALLFGINKNTAAFGTAVFF